MQKAAIKSLVNTQLAVLCTASLDAKRRRGRNLNWRRLDELRFEFPEPPRSIEVAVHSTANCVLTRDIFLLAIPTRS